MNILNKVTWQAMWKNKTRTIVTIIGIILSAAMFTAVTTLGVSLVSYLIDISAYNEGDYFIRYDYGTDSEIEGIYQEDYVSQIGDLKALGYTTFFLNDAERGELSETCVVAAGDDNFFNMISARLKEGRLPTNSNEIIITGNAVAYLEGAGLPCGIGDTVTMTVVPEYAPKYNEVPVDLPTDGTAFTKDYTIVGITERFYNLDDFTLYISYLLTYADENVEPALWHRIYVKTDPAKAAYDFQDKPYGPVRATNTSMLNLYGASQYSNVNYFIYAICGVLMSIIMIGSISLIYNAFSISVSERTKQFGLLSSIGATKRQLRRSVYFEAMSLCLIGIPIGIFCGYFGVALTLHLTSGLINGMLAGSIESGVELHAVASVPAFICAGVVAAVTVFLSVLIPAKRATKVAPISAIRQTQDYQVPKRGLKAGKMTAKIWGLPGMMAQKYYAVSKHKYRATVISLAISVVLFITSCGFTQVLQNTADSNANTYNFDMYVYNLSEVQMEELRNHPAVSRSVICSSNQWNAIIPSNILSEEYTMACEIYNDSTLSEDDNGAKYVNIHYIEDEAFRSYLEEQNINPDPYFDTEHPTALVMGGKIIVYKQNGQNTERLVYETPVFENFSGPLVLFDSVEPDAVLEYLNNISPNYYWNEGSYQGYPMDIYRFTGPISETTFESTPYLQEDGSISIVKVYEKNEAGEYIIGYYLYDPSTDVLAEDPLATRPIPQNTPAPLLGETVDELPFGVTNYTRAETITLAMPLSMVNTEAYPPELRISINDYDAITVYLDEKGCDYGDLLESQMQYRNIVTMTNVFSYGFIILISLICVCNVFNTISTNIALRRRDFGMLRSVGMQSKELNRMMIYECLRYGIRSLFMGLPLGILGSFGINSLAAGVGNSYYEIPLIPMAVSIISVFVVVFISMLYALSKLKKDNPIEAIRMENL